MIMTSNLRKFALTVHVVSSVGLLGSIAAFLVLSNTGLNSEAAEVIRAAYFSMNLLAKVIIAPVAVVALISGIVQSVGTPWGLFRHYWVAAKLLITTFATTILLIKLKLIGHAADLAAQTVLPRAELYAAGVELRLHAAAGLLVLLVPAILSVYKPRGLTAYGRQRLTQRVTSQAHDSSSIASIGVSASSGSLITLSLRRSYLVVFVLAVVLVHIAILQAVNGGHMSHFGHQGH